MKRGADPARRLAYRVIRGVGAQGAYANIKTAQQLRDSDLQPRDAAFATELIAGTCRLAGTYDRIIESASGRPRLDDGVRAVLRLQAHQLLSMRVPAHAAISSSVDLARAEIGEWVTGLVNAVGRRIAARDLDGWLDLLGERLELDPLDALALRTHHPRWIVDALADVLPADELQPMLLADNTAPPTHLAVRPGLAEVAELTAAGATPARFSPYGACFAGPPAQLVAVRDGRAGVQDEGSQLVALAAARAPAPYGPWLDLCAGPGGKAALLAGLAIAGGVRLVAAELHRHRAELVARALRGYDGPLAPVTVVADGRRGPFRPGTFAKVVVDVPCSGLGVLRRRSDSRWRRRPEDIAQLVELQRALLIAGIEAAKPGGVVAYVTCSPIRAETAAVVDAVAPGRADVLTAAEYLPEVPNAASGEHVQLWPHRHGTDAMFLALLRRR